MPTSSRMADWRAAADPVDLREYDRFGPWIDQVRAEIDMPRRFRPWYGELAGATFLLKVPRSLDRAQVRPGMDLYEAVLAIFPDRLCLLRADAAAVVRSDLTLDRVVATNTYTNLLVGRWSLLLADGTSFDVDYNTVSQAVLEEVDRYVWRHPATDAGQDLLLPAVRVTDHLFASILATRAATTDAPLRPVHVEEPGRPCRDDRLRRRTSTGLMVLESPDELVVVNRGEPTRSRFRTGHYASDVLTVPFDRMTSFSVVDPPADPPGQFHRLVLGCDRQVISQPCLLRPDTVATLLAARGVPQL